MTVIANSALQNVFQSVHTILRNQMPKINAKVATIAGAIFGVIGTAVTFFKGHKIVASALGAATLTGLTGLIIRYFLKRGQKTDPQDGVPKPPVGSEDELENYTYESEVEDGTGGEPPVPVEESENAPITMKVESKPTTKKERKEMRLAWLKDCIAQSKQENTEAVEDYANLLPEFQERFTAVHAEITTLEADIRRHAVASIRGNILASKKSEPEIYSNFQRLLGELKKLHAAIVSKNDTLLEDEKLDSQFFTTKSGTYVDSMFRGKTDLEGILNLVTIEEMDNGDKYMGDMLQFAQMLSNVIQDKEAEDAKKAGKSNKKSDVEGSDPKGDGVKRTGSEGPEAEESEAKGPGSEGPEAEESKAKGPGSEGPKAEESKAKGPGSEGPKAEESEAEESEDEES